MKKLTPGKLLKLPTGHSGNGWSEIMPMIPCPKEYQFSRVREVQPRAWFTPAYLAEGSLLHAARAQWLNDGYEGDLWRTQVTHYAGLLEQAGEHLPRGIVDRTIKDFEGYVKYWKVRPKPEVLAIEYKVGPKVLPGAPEWTARSARYDSIERWHGETWIGELKSTSRGAGRVGDLYALNGQTLLYPSLWDDALSEKFGPLAGVLMDPLVKGSGSRLGTGAARIPLRLDRMQHALAWFKKDFPVWVMQSKMIKWDDHVERKPMCLRPNGPCPYRELCLMGKKAALRYTFKDGRSITNWKPSDTQRTPPWE